MDWAVAKAAFQQGSASAAAAEQPGVPPAADAEALSQTDKDAAQPAELEAQAGKLPDPDSTGDEAPKQRRKRQRDLEAEAAGSSDQSAQMLAKDGKKLPEQEPAAGADAGAEADTDAGMQAAVLRKLLNDDTVSDLASFSNHILCATSAAIRLPLSASCPLS